jgi:SNF2 family DNA or RNA helicase
MLTKLHAEVNGVEITAVNEAVKVMKLVQCAVGAMYDGSGETAFVPATNRLALTEEIIEEAGSKVIVFVPFTGALEAVAKHLAKKYTVEIIQGSTPKGERDRIFREFQHTDNPRVLVAQASAMSHGLTLTAASVIIWFAPVNSLETYEQACARITRPGQKLNQLIVNIEGSPVEKAMYERLQKKGKMQGLLLDLLKQGV